MKGLKDLRKAIILARRDMNKKGISQSVINRSDEVVVNRLIEGIGLNSRWFHAKVKGGY